MLSGLENYVEVTYKEPLLKFAKLILHNEQGSPIAQMKIRPGLTPESKIIGAIAVHTAIVISSRAHLPLLLPFLNMLHHPAALTVSFVIQENGQNPCALSLLIIVMYTS